MVGRRMRALPSVAVIIVSSAARISWDHRASRGNCELAFVVALALLMAVTLTPRGNSDALIARANSRSGAALISRSPGTRFNVVNAPTDLRSIRTEFQDPFTVGRVAVDLDTESTSPPARSATVAMLIPNGEVAPIITTRRLAKSLSVPRVLISKKSLLSECFNQLTGTRLQSHPL